METMQRSEQSLCLLDFWTSPPPKSHLSKLKCEKVNRKSTLCMYMRMYKVSVL